MAVDSDTNFEFALMVHTNAYTGNFERELCAYATGSVGDCNVGHQYVDSFEAAFAERFPGEEPGDIQDLTSNIADDRGCHRPATIWDWKNDHYKSLAIFFEDRPAERHMTFIKERALEFAKLNSIAITGFTWVKRTITIVDEEETDLS